MVSTLILCLAVVLLVILQFGLWGWCLRLGLRWAGVPFVTWRSIFVAFVANAVLTKLWSYIALNSGILDLLGELLFYFLAIVVSVFLSVYIIKTIYGTSVLGSFKAWLPTLIAPCVAVAFLLLSRQFLFEAFVVPTNAMAPTIVGEHWLSRCEQCDQPSYCYPMLASMRLSPMSSKLICENFHVTQSASVSKKKRSRDRILVAKFLNPKRWDIISFQVPENPEEIYISRLVGLPGDAVHIDDGAVWINGQRQVPPEPLEEIVYVPLETGFPSGDQWGTAENPAILGDDELYVLSDFSAMSLDSRSWQKGAPGHNPYAVPQENVLGVVTHTFWPTNRWRIHR